MKPESALDEHMEIGLALASVVPAPAGTVPSELARAAPS